MRLDTSSYEITRLAAAPSARVDTYSNWLSPDGTRVVFPVVRECETDQELRIVFDLLAHTWGGAYPQKDSPAD